MRNLRRNYVKISPEVIGKDDKKTMVCEKITVLSSSTSIKAKYILKVLGFGQGCQHFSYRSSK